VPTSSAERNSSGKASGARTLAIPSARPASGGWEASTSLGFIVVFSDAVQLPRLGRVRLKERGHKERGYLPTDAPNLAAPVREQAGHWWVSVLVEQEHVVPRFTGPVVGADLGIKKLATLSDGTKEPNPRHVKQRLRKLKRCQRTASRRRKGSSNRRSIANWRRSIPQ
jgi:putative transposase